MKDVLKYGVAIFVGIALLTGAVISLLPHHLTATVMHTSVAAPPNVTDTYKWGLAFSDEFTGTTLNTTKWVTCYDWHLVGSSGCTNSGNNEQEWYEPSHVSIGNGVATLTATKDPVTITENGSTKTYPYTSGMISTGRSDTTSAVKWSGKYGYYEARMKFDGGQGVWPAFWLLPTNQKWPPEIDAMEMLGGKPNQVLLTSHWANSAGTPQEDSSVITSSDFTQGWHTYAVNWQPGRIDWYIDGKLEKSVVSSTVSNTPMEIILDLAIGGNLPGNADAATPFPRTAQIDYVRVYGLKL